MEVFYLTKEDELQVRKALLQLPGRRYVAWVIGRQEQDAIGVVRVGFGIDKTAVHHETQDARAAGRIHGPP